MTRTLKTAFGGSAFYQSLRDGTIPVEGLTIDHVPAAGGVAEIFARMCRRLEFDVCEMSISSYLQAKVYGLPFTAIPVFTSRSFHHGSFVYNVNAGIERPRDLEGRRVGVRNYTNATGVWVRGMLSDELGVDLDKITWVLSDEESVAETEAPANCVYELGADLGAMVSAGELAGMITIGQGPLENTRPLVADARPAAAASYERTGVFPINHTIVIKDDLLAADPSIAVALYEGFKQAKALWLTSASESDRTRSTQGIVEGDPYPFGVEANRPTLETLVRYGQEQHILPRRLIIDAIFASGTEDPD
jgi:4,5-dihydroxyphthalate decarboxylase